MSNPQTIDEVKSVWATYRYPLYYYLSVVGTLFISQQPLFGNCLVFMLGMLVPTATLLVLVFGNGWQRLFAVGAMIPAFVMLCGSVAITVYSSFEGWDDIDDFEGAAAFLAMTLLVLPPSGLAMLGLRRFLLATQESGEDQRSLTHPEAQQSQPVFAAYQFSIKSMFLFTTICAVICLVMFALPDFLAVAGVLLMMFLWLTIWLGVLYLSFSRCDAPSLLSRWRLASLASTIPMIGMLAILVSLLIVALFESTYAFDNGGLAAGIKVSFAVLGVLSVTFGFVGSLAAKRIQELSSEMPDRKREPTHDSDAPNS